MRGASLSVPVVVAAVLLPGGGRVDVLPVLVRLPLPLPLALRLPYGLPVRVVVAVVVAQRIPVRVVAQRVPIDVVVVRRRQRALALSAYETAT